MRYVVSVDGKDHVVELGAPDAAGNLQVLLDGKPRTVNPVVLQNGAVSLLVDGHSYDVETERPAGADELSPRLNVRVRGNVFALEVMDERRKALQEAGARGGGAGSAGNVLSPMPGKVVKILKAVGAEVKAGEGVIVVEAMKMENELKAGAPGTVKEVRVKEGQAVEAGAVLVVLG